MNMFVPKLILLLSITLLLSICNKEEIKIERQDLGLIENNRINEGSGIDNSGINDNVFWLHNDSGDRAQIFAMNKKGKHLGRFILKGIENRDWEDIAIGPGPVENQSYIYIGEIGDNKAKYEMKFIYRIKEPHLDIKNIPYDSVIQEVDKISFQYPDGPRDAETLMIDPLTKDLIVISKREDNVHVYVLYYPQSTDSLVIPELIAALPLTNINGGDISSSGTKIIIKNYEQIFSWNRKPKQALAEVFSNESIRLPYIEEPQGEAICWSKDEKAYFTVSEEDDNIEARLYFYPFK